jgi:hypothetical protein
MMLMVSASFLFLIRKDIGLIGRSEGIVNDKSVFEISLTMRISPGAFDADGVTLSAVN